MFVYLITYELHHDKDYHRINEAIESLGGCIHCLRSIWLVKTGFSLPEIHEILKDKIDADDSLLILKPSLISHSNTSYHDTYPIYLVAV